MSPTSRASAPTRGSGGGPSAGRRSSRTHRREALPLGGPTRGRGERLAQAVERGDQLGVEPGVPLAGRAHQASGAYGRAQRATWSVTALNHAWCIASTVAGSSPPASRKGRTAAVIGYTNAIMYRGGTAGVESTPYVRFFAASVWRSAISSWSSSQARSRGRRQAPRIQRPKPARTRPRWSPMGRPPGSAKWATRCGLAATKPYQTVEHVLDAAYEHLPGPRQGALVARAHHHRGLEEREVLVGRRGAGRLAGAIRDRRAPSGGTPRAARLSLRRRCPSARTPTRRGRARSAPRRC